MAGYARPADVALLGRGLLAAGAVSLVTAAVPFSPTAPRGTAALLGVAALALGGTVLARARRTTVVAVHALVALATAVTGGCVALSTTPAGTAVTAVGSLWVVLYTSLVHPRRAVAAHVGGVAVATALGLLLAGATSAPQTWFFLTAIAVGIAVALTTTVERLHREATRDPLTGVLTRRALEEAVGQACRRAERSGAPLTLVVLDLDGFKGVNDRHGHAAGDALLVALTAAWRTVLRPDDVLGRLGGDEFALLLPGATPDGTRDVLGRLRAAHPQAWSAGTAVWAGEGWAQWCAAADRDLYAHKRR
ncbi:GGDEF domain-containing protein [Cellulomonas endophytica]|uniref:GGDEF domain-containing protein n=1 Tax=Cellulomonas endophytica TaxID=2494735 RepID=UPI0010135E25|nr:GGDEF domain-containing protein [Cellulomonas endophytica]